MGKALKKHLIVAVIAICVSFASWLAFWYATRPLARELESAYAKLQSPILLDRTGKDLDIRRNANGMFDRFGDSVPPRVVELLVKSEDRFFYLHPGINPFSMLRGATAILVRKRSATSTITQQLAKILLQTEQQRSLKNKLKETLYTLALEQHVSKDRILLMYANAAYFGNQAQGIEQASRVYFSKNTSSLEDSEIMQLLASLPNPTRGYPGTQANKDATFVRSQRVDLQLKKDIPSRIQSEPKKNSASFEARSLASSCAGTCTLTLDSDLINTVREIMRRTLLRPAFSSAANGAVVILKLPENELVAVVGSPDPSSQTHGYQLNMATKPRPIGSTAKPFIYLKGFEKGLRPATIVDDREYKFSIGTGFSLYPKNYDYRYHGKVSLHYALSNSLNVPTVKVLEYVGVGVLSSFLSDKLGFKPAQPLESYGLGIALGGLEMDLLTLSHLFTIFPHDGLLKPLKITVPASKDRLTLTAPMEKMQSEKRVADPRYVQLVTKILSDRQTGVEQFGVKSSLNLPFSNYAVKTGTSREFHDSWTIGYTPDFLVGVWVGNSDNTPLKDLSGQAGAGQIWHDVMQLMGNSKYNRATPLATGRVKEYATGSAGMEFGLEGDDPTAVQNVLLSQDASLILEPHNRDVFLLGKDSTISLKAKRSVTWSINGREIAHGEQTFFAPKTVGQYTILARDENGIEEKIQLSVLREK